MALGLILLLGLAALVAVPVTVRAVSRRQQRAERQVAASAQAMGLLYVPGAWNAPPSFTAIMGGRGVRVSWVTTSTPVQIGEMTTTTFSTSTHYLVNGLPPALEAKAEGLGASVKRVFGVTDHQTGDAAFDQAVFLRGDAETLGAFADPTVRARLSQLTGAGATIQGGTLALVVSGQNEVPKICEWLEALGAFLVAFDQASSHVPARWLEGVTNGTDEERGVRALLTHFVGRPETVEACELGRTSSNLVVRALAATGRADGAQLRSVFIDPEASPRARMEALRGLLSTGSTQWLDAELEPLLLELFAQHDGEDRRLIAQALGHAGTAAAVPALRAESGFFDNAALRKDAEAAVEQIQARLGNAQRGQLGLADGEAKTGALSEAEVGGVGLIPPD